ncbi:multidrug transporter [Breznakia pachnodae]|uniref:Multidrug transporter n=1 Tax=Breznakia pachnodae TaxID=265178 RepID=A0ABU0DZF0_9FIRM|nr:multidrug transporter [Breznakia pachnodae]MDQ0359826.1 hypothetical protein [Breznakia pachnodae]
MQEVNEKDWKLFRSKVSIWQENYIDRLNKEYIELLSEDENPSEKFWKLERRISKDKRNKGVILDMKRSSLMMNLVSLIREEAIDLDDLDEFSDGLKESVNTIVTR